MAGPVSWNLRQQRLQALNLIACGHGKQSRPRPAWQLGALAVATEGIVRHGALPRWKSRTGRTQLRIETRALTTARQLKHRLYLTQRATAATVSGPWLRSHGSFRTQLKQARQNIDFSAPISSSPGIWAVGMVKNEADIIESSIRHLQVQGIDKILVVDNMSTDGTGEKLHRLSEEVPGLIVGQDLEPGYFQSAKMTLLGDLARKAGASWIVPFDADEFWFGQSGTVAETLRRSRDAVARAQVFNVFPGVATDGWYIDDQPHFDAKVAFQPFRGSVISMGNHEVTRPGRRRDVLRIIHYPWRSFEQYQRKVRQGAEALSLTDLPTELGYHWRALGTATPEQLLTSWHQLLRGNAPDSTAWRPRGRLHPVGQEHPATWADALRILSSGTSDS